MDTPLPVETPKEEEMIKFKDNQGKIIDVKFLYKIIIFVFRLF